MKKIRIYFSSDFQENTDFIKEIDGPAINVDLSILVNHYRKMGEKNLKYVEKFIPLWENEFEDGLFEPKARIALMSFYNMKKKFGCFVDYGKVNINMSALMVWTVGEEIERKSSSLMSLRGDLMLGCLLDVAGSIALYGMHKILLKWINDNVGKSSGNFLSGEVYPGLISTTKDLMDKIEVSGHTKDTIGVSAQGNLMLKPRKTQCSFVGLGPETHLEKLPVMPCYPCSGKKCLYYQLGGCHMDLFAAK